MLIITYILNTEIQNKKYEWILFNEDINLINKPDYIYT